MITDNKKRGQYIFKIIRRLWVLGGLSFLAWLAYSYQSRDLPAAILQSDSQVTVTQNSDFISFSPATNQHHTGFIFYPGGLVDPLAYAPMARQVAENGFAVYIIKLPLRSAGLPGQEDHVFSKTRQLIEATPTLNQWVLGGHSRGAAIASRLASAEPTLFAGLILIGTSHPKTEEFNLSSKGLQVMKIYATQDGLASEAEIEETSWLLPTDTHWVKIEGGNHAQFAYVGYLLGDNPAEISREAQQAIMISAILSMLQKIDQQY